MPARPSSVEQQLDRIIEQYLTLNGDHLPCQSFDPKWSSACWVSDSEPSEGTETAWKPAAMHSSPDMFQRLEEALGTSIHTDVVDYYSRYWSDPIRCRHQEGELELLFCWNEEDLERLRGNLVGHLLILKKRRQPLSLFFACTDGDEFMVVNNEDGSVWLERPGGKRIRQLSASLAEFLADLEPCALTPQ